MDSKVLEQTREKLELEKLLYMFQWVITLEIIYCRVNTTDTVINPNNNALECTEGTLAWKDFILCI